jgi:hypothetical protein
VTWLLKLYPPRWRRRYGEEFLALIVPQRFSIGTAIDIIGGAIDAWTQPQSHLSPRERSNPEGETIMLAKVMRLRCAGYGTKVTPIDGLKGAGVVIGGTLLMVLISTWMRQNSLGDSYASALMANGWLFAFIVSMRYTTLKGSPGRTQAIFMGGLIFAIAILTLFAGWANGH